MLFHLAVDLGLDFLVHLLHGEFLLQHKKDLHDPLLGIKGFKESLLLVPRDNHTGKVIGKPYGFLNVCSVEFQVVQKCGPVLAPCNFVAQCVQVGLVLNGSKGFFLYVLNLGADYALVAEHFKDPEALYGLKIKTLGAVECGYLVLDSDKGSDIVQVICSELGRRFVLGPQKQKAQSVVVA